MRLTRRHHSRMGSRSRQAAGQLLQCAVLSCVCLGLRGASPVHKRLLFDSGIAFTGSSADDDSPSAIPVPPSATRMKEQNAAVAPAPSGSAPAPAPVSGLPAWAYQMATSSASSSASSNAVSTFNASAAALGASPRTAPGPFSQLREPPKGIPPSAFMRANATPATNASFATPQQSRPVP